MKKKKYNNNGKFFFARKIKIVSVPNCLKVYLLRIIRGESVTRKKAAAGSVSDHGRHRYDPNN